MQGTEKVVCPDCKEVLDEVVIERFSLRTYRINYDTMELEPAHPEWIVDDHARRCVVCDTLNVDCLMTDFRMVESEPEADVAKSMNELRGVVASVLCAREEFEKALRPDSRIAENMRDYWKHLGVAD